MYVLITPAIPALYTTLWLDAFCRIALYIDNKIESNPFCHWYLVACEGYEVDSIF